MKALGDQHSLQDVKALGIAARCTVQPYWMPSNGYYALPFVERRALCARVHFAGSASSASRVITGNLMMPGFTAPKLLWFSGMSRRYSVKSTKYYYRKLLASAYDGGVCQRYV